MNNANTTYFVVSAPGYYGDQTKVLSSHRTIAAAKRAIGAYRGLVVRTGALTRGDTFFRADEPFHPIAR